MCDVPFTILQLRILNAIYTEGNFTKAAKKLYISQPAVSAQMKILEEHLNTNVFNRNKRQRSLTETGQILLKYSTRILDLCEDTCRALDEKKVQQATALKLGASQTVGNYLMPKLMGLYSLKYPQVELELQVHSTRKIAFAVANEQVDIAIVGGDIPFELKETLNITNYAEDELVLIVAKSHPFSSFEFIKKEDLYRLKFVTLDTLSTIRSFIENTLAQNGIHIQYCKGVLELNSVEAIKNAVESDLGVAFVSASSIAKELRLGSLHCLKIEGLTIKRSLLIVTNKKYNETNLRYSKKEILESFIKVALNKNTSDKLF